MDDPGCSATSSEEAELREQLISKHYSRRVTELTSQLQLSDSKALHFYAEVLHLPLKLSRVLFDWFSKLDSGKIETQQDSLCHVPGLRSVGETLLCRPDHIEVLIIVQQQHQHSG